MINSVAQPNHKPALPFPKLMICKTLDFIVLFRENDIGIVVYSTSDTYPIGFICSSWNMKNFTTYNGTIMLENKKEL